MRGDEHGFDRMLDGPEHAREEVPDGLEDAADPGEAGGIEQRQRVVADVGIVVERLQVGGVLHEWVGGQACEFVPVGGSAPRVRGTHLD